MINITSNRWSVENNQLSMQLDGRFVTLDFVDYYGQVECEVNVYERSQPGRKYPFTKLDEAIFFVEEVVTRCEDINKLVDLYDDLIAGTLLLREDWRSYGRKK